MDTDLHQIIRSNQPLTDEHVQYFAYQVGAGPVSGGGPALRAAATPPLLGASRLTPQAAPPLRCCAG